VPRTLWPASLSSQALSSNNTYIFLGFPISARRSSRANGLLKMSIRAGQRAHFCAYDRYIGFFLTICGMYALYAVACPIPKRFASESDLALVIESPNAFCPGAISPCETALTTTLIA
jgi:hypothetical protein